MDIQTDDISILIRGKVEKKTKTVIESARKLFPSCKIILSTWKDSDVNDLDFDILVENEAPGAQVFNAPLNAQTDKNGDAFFELHGKEYHIKPKPNNVNRIIKTIQSGLEKVTTKYVLNIRTDIILKNKKFLKYWNKFPKYNGKYKIFKHRIINNSTFAQFAHVMNDGTQLLPFHMSDWIHFGLTEDIKLLYSCPFQDQEDASQYWYKRERKQYEPYINTGWQYPPETYVLYTLVKQKYPNVEFRDSDHYNKENMSVSNMIMADNFIFVNQQDFTFEMDKYPKLKDWDSELYTGFITHKEFQNLYRTYCDNSYKFFDIDFDRIIYFKKIFNLGYFLKYPRRYFKLFKEIKYLFNKKDLRKAFCIGVTDEM